MKVFYLPTTDAPLSAKASAYSLPMPAERKTDEGNVWAHRDRVKTPALVITTEVVLNVTFDPLALP